MILARLFGEDPEASNADRALSGDGLAGPAFGGSRGRREDQAQHGSVLGGRVYPHGTGLLAAP